MEVGVAQPLPVEGTPNILPNKYPVKGNQVL